MCAGRTTQGAKSDEFPPNILLSA